jgi:hypothetical protein
MWARYESLVNLAFASSPVTIMCTYDKRTIPEGFVADARYTHPEVVRGNDATASPTYREPQDFLLAPQAASRQGAGPGTF